MKDAREKLKRQRARIREMRLRLAHMIPPAYGEIKNPPGGSVDRRA